VRQIDAMHTNLCVVTALLQTCIKMDKKSSKFFCEKLIHTFVSET